ncbi:MAG: DUF3592 domain-containing protein [Candidatus Micrarchaeota archaeon]|nr:DUF3592 domain-containing protein [Candidatus Micrarchaeota archaeon]
MAEISVNMSPKIAYPLMIVLGLLFLVGFSYLAYNDYTASSTWKSVNAVVDHSNLMIIKNTGSDNSRYMFQANISYRYTIDGTEHSGHCCSSSSSDNVGVQSMVDRNSAGKTAEVLVNPSNPSESRLKEDTSPINMFIEMIVALLGLGMMIAGIKKAMSNPNPPDTKQENIPQ